MSAEEETTRRSFFPAVPPWFEVVWLIAILILGSWGLWNFHYIADDLLVIRSYTSIDTAGSLSTQWSQVASDFVGPWGGNPWLTLYRPLPSVSLALDFSVFGLSPLVTAYGNLLIHACSVFLVWRLGKRLLPDSRSALIAAMLFAATPLAHENLAWAVARCGINMPLSLAATLVFLRRYERGLRGRSLQWPVMLLLVAALMSYEQALFWTLFPMVALLLGALFLKVEVEERGLGLARLFAPHIVLIPLYLGLRLLLLGSLSGGREVEILPGGPIDGALAALDRLVEALVPMDASFILPQGRNQTYWRWLCLLPVMMGMMAPLHIVDPRSRRYRRALYLLLGFWLITRVPNLTMELREGLDSARVSYYSYAPIALLLGLLLATTRYSRWLAFALAIAFAFNLQHRVATRCLWGEKGVQARELLFAEAEKRHAIEGQGENLLCYINRVDGVMGAPAYQPGEMAFALFPTLVPATVRGLSLHKLILQQEVFAAAAIAKASGGLVAVEPPASEDAAPKLVEHDITPYLEDKPDPGLDLEFHDLRGFPFVRYKQEWRKDPALAEARPVLILVAGSSNLVLPLPADVKGFIRIPDAMAKALRTWSRRSPPRAPIALLLELRTHPKQPRTCVARSQVVFTTW